MKFFLSLICSLSFLLNACGTHTKTSEVKIYGGKPSSSGAWPSAVGITTVDSLYCSGTAIHPRVVITAAHCLRGNNTWETRVYVGDGVSGGKMSGQYTAASIRYSPKYGYGAEGMNDIGYIVLNQDLNLSPSDYVPILTDPAEIKELLQPGARSQLVGFGNTDTQELGVKYEVSANITSVNGNEVTIGGGGRDACQGDSGGPAYGQLKNGEWRVYGIVSRGEDCGGGGEWGLMHANICWVQSSSGIDLGLPEGYCKAEAEQPATHPVVSAPTKPEYEPESSDSSSDDPHPPGFDYGAAYGGYIDWLWETGGQY